MGQFYDAIKKGKLLRGQGYFAVTQTSTPGLDYLNKHDPSLFHPETAAYQFAPGLGYQPRVRDAGGSVVVTDIDTANTAINIIVDQGEGNPGPYDDPSKEEKDHYDVFRDLQSGTQTWEVYPVRINPTTLGYWAEDKRIYQVRGSGHRSSGMTC